MDASGRGARELSEETSINGGGIDAGFRADTFAFVSFATAQATRLLPSWNYDKARKFIVEFVAKVTKKGSSDFVAYALGRTGDVFSRLLHLLPRQNLSPQPPHRRAVGGAAFAHRG